MKIKMTSTQDGSIDGIRVSSYEAGEEYDLTRTAGERELATAFVGARMAVKVTEPDQPTDKPVARGSDEQKAMSVPENKALYVPANKRGKRKG